MGTETTITIMMILFCCLIMAALDAAVCGLLNLFAGVQFKKAFLWGLISLAVPILFIAYGSLIGRNLFEVKKVDITFENLPAGFDGYRIVQISDIHASSFVEREDQLAKAVGMINSLEPDLIVFTGDLITLSPDELNTLTGPLSELKAKDGVMSVLGNHDYSMYSNASPQQKEEHLKALIAKEKELGWDLLLNENRIIRRGCDSIAVIGVENTSPSRHFPSKGNLAKASEGTDGTFRILLSHDPMHWDAEVVGKDYPLTLSGHTHAMQFSIFGWNPSSIIYQQNRGLYTKGKQHLYVNIGLGETLFPARIGARPEITLITLNK
ncbi:MAG: metallophosphoesterase [Bacteroidales bacterium]|nr:metallophosphoesterase [Bacteroidales bacterium]